MNVKETVLDILEEIIGSDEAREDLNVDLFEEGLLDSLGTIQLLVELEGQCQVSVPISEFDREVWATPQKIIDQVTALRA